MRLIRSLVLLLVLTLATSLLVSPGNSSLFVKGTGFRYSPIYGDLKDGLDHAAPYYDIASFFDNHSGFSISTGWFPGNWGITLEVFGFTTVADFYHKRLPERYIFTTSTAPILVSLVYRTEDRKNKSFYFGAGTGIFRSKLKIEADIKGKTSQEDYVDSPTGYQLLAGGQYILRDGLGFFIEARRIFAKAEYPGYRCVENCTTDWSGLFLGIGLIYEFGST